MRDSKLHRPALNAISRCLISKVSANLIALVITETSQDLPITMSCRFLISDLFILYSLPVVGGAEAPFSFLEHIFFDEVICQHSANIDPFASSDFRIKMTALNCNNIIFNCVTIFSICVRFMAKCNFGFFVFANKLFCRHRFVKILSGTLWVSVMVYINSYI